MTAPVDRATPGAIMPRRHQRSRAKGSRLLEGVKYVGRPGKFGNEWEVAQERAYGSRLWKVRRVHRGSFVYLGSFATREEANRAAVDGYWLAKPAGFIDVVRAELAGLDLACWCGLSLPCHADLLLHAANPELDWEVSR